jgi:hypothetical protein
MELLKPKEDIRVHIAGKWVERKVLGVYVYS